MSDENTPDVPNAGVPDTTPTEPVTAVEPLADQQPWSDDAGSDAEVTGAAPGRTHTRTILEIVGGVVAAGLIIVAGVGGFAAGLVVGDGDGRGHDDGRGFENRADGPMGQGFGKGHGDDDGHQGKGGRGFGDEGERGQGERGQGERGQGERGQGERGRGFDMNPGQVPDGDELRGEMQDLLRQFMDEFGEGMDLENMLPGPMGSGQGNGPGQQSQG